jgi:hypothetical protein
MRGATGTVTLYYLAFGLAIFLGWGIAVPDRALDTSALTRLARRHLRDDGPLAGR